MWPAISRCHTLSENVVDWGFMAPSASRLVAQVSEWFVANGRPLPWREENPGPWGILVVEVMSQQTPIQRVLPVWQEWMQRWPAPGDLAAAAPAEVIRAWGRMGYPRRALQLQEAARIIDSEYGGKVPAAEADLLDLPGVGPYTAAAVRSFAHGERAVVLDTNIRRVLTRTLDGIALPPTHVRASERARAERLVPREREAAALWNAAVMEFGALVCTARRPACRQCPLTSCAWREAGYPENAPLRRAQPWIGSDRQIRGAIMAQLRESEVDLAQEALISRVRAAHPDAPASQVERALTALIEDSLVEESAGTYHLPR